MLEIYLLFILLFIKITSVLLRIPQHCNLDKNHKILKKME